MSPSPTRYYPTPEEHWEWTSGYEWFPREIPEGATQAFRDGWWDYSRWLDRKEELRQERIEREAEE
jgi:hypothetical protein